MKIKYLIYFFTILIVSNFSCTKPEIPPQFIQGVEKIKSQWAPDKRIAVFNVEWKLEGDTWVIIAETTIPEAGKELEDLSKEFFPNNTVDLKLNLLPDKELGDSTYALVRISSANLRKGPRYSAELVDQSVLGTELKLLKYEKGMYFIQNPYNYLGWMLRGSISITDKEGIDNWNKSKKISIKTNYAQIFSQPNNNSLPVSDAVLGATLKFIKSSGKWIHVEIPDGRTGYIEKKYTEDFLTLNNNPKIDRNKLIKKAKSLLGIPYLWGGNSTKAIDCSGFSQTVFKSLGYLLPRDANMQVNIGTEIQITDNFENVLPGDLLFFGPENRIIHVGISLGGPLFIHSSGDVHINSFLKDDENYNSYRKNGLQYIKRIIKN